MSTDVPVLYDKDTATPVPSAWRETLIKIIEAFKNNDLESFNNIDGIKKLNLDAIQEIAFNIIDYGETLISLPDETWNTSECSWVGVCWNVIVDLFTEKEGRSDLILSVKVFEKDGSFEFSVQDIFVP